MFFDTPWTRLSDSQIQSGRRAGRTVVTRASEYFAIGPIRSLSDRDWYDPRFSTRYQYKSVVYKPSSWKRENTIPWDQRGFIKINGKEIF